MPSTRRLSLRLALLFAAACLGLTARSAQAHPPLAPFQPGDCPVPAPSSWRVRCGFLLVPEDHARPDGRAIRLAVAVVSSARPSAASDPLIFLNGGPGAPTLRDLPLLISLFEPYLQQRDLVLFDQRGVGFSQPNLECPELNAATPDQQPEPERLRALALDLLGQCRARLLAQGIDLSAYTSAQSAADLEDLRQALGYSTWNLYGVSYGTRLALTVLRDFPAGLRSVTLDSTYPPEADLAQAPGAFERALNRLAAACARDLGCRLAYPDLRAALYGLSDQLQAAPVPSGQADPARVDGVTVMEAAFDALYFPAGLAALPAATYNARAGRYADLLALNWSRQLTESVSLGLALSVQCAEEAPFTDRAAFQAARQSLPPAIARFADRRVLFSQVLLDMCAVWSVRPAAARENQPVTGAAPTLILAGEFDPVTPPAWGRAVAARLPGATFLEVPGAGHNTVLAGACPTGLILAFLKDPSAALDPACLGRMDHSPNFLIRAEASRSVALVLLPLLSFPLLVLSARAARTALRLRRFTWLVSLRLAGWLPIAAGALVLAAFLVFGRSNAADAPPLALARLVETILPLAAAVQAALFFSPEDEPGLEMQAALPRPLAWTVLERWALVLAGHGLVALLGGLLAARLTGEAPALSVVRWLSPLLFLTGAALCLTLITRQTIFGLGLALLLWFGLAWAGDGLLVRWPFLWPIHVYLQPGHAFYALNRALVALFGLGMTALAATRLIGDAERLLLGGARSARFGREAGNASGRGLSAWPALQNFARAPRWLFQLTGLVRYEFLLAWRQRALPVLCLAAAVLPLGAAFFMRGQLGEMAGSWVQSGGLDLEQARRAVTANLTLMSWASLYVVWSLLLPPAAAAAVPRDQRLGVRELLRALPLDAGVYLLGKLLGLWAALLAGLLVIFGGVGLLWQAMVGPLDWGIYLRTVALGGGALAAVQSGLAILLAAGQPTPGRAVMVGLGWGLLGLFCLGIGQRAAPGLAYYLNPGHPAFFSYFIWGQFGSGSLGNLTVAAWPDVAWTLAASLAELLALWLWRRRALWAARTT